MEIISPAAQMHLLTGSIEGGGLPGSISWEFVAVLLQLVVPGGST